MARSAHSYDFGLRAIGYTGPWQCVISAIVGDPAVHAGFNVGSGFLVSLISWGIRRYMLDSMWDPVSSFVARFYIVDSTWATGSRTGSGCPCGIQCMVVDISRVPALHPVADAADPGTRKDCGFPRGRQCGSCDVGGDQALHAGSNVGYGVPSRLAKSRWDPMGSSLSYQLRSSMRAFMRYP